MNNTLSEPKILYYDVLILRLNKYITRDNYNILGKDRYNL